MATNSKLVQTDPLSSHTYQQTGFNPANQDDQLSRTSSRVAQRVYNQYQPNPDFQVFGYYTDWSQYDGRLGGETEPSEAGRGTDLMLLPSDAYDKLIIGFAGIVGDTGEKGSAVSAAATALGLKADQVTLIDLWGDLQASRNCGFAGSVDVPYLQLFDQNHAQGIMGGMRLLKERNPNLRLGLSIGGWTMSTQFSGLAADPRRRGVFISSILDLLKRFPMLTDLDIDWEYPGMAGSGHPYAPGDAGNFQTLIRELRQQLNGSGRSDVKISIACHGGVSGLKLADIPGMIQAGVDGVNVMTYDYFGATWAPQLAHHSNLRRNPQADPVENYSIEAAVDYLEQQGVDLKKVFIGYAAYSRNAAAAQLNNVSPLNGSFSRDKSAISGTFESAVTEWYDLIYNYLDLENLSGRNGYQLYTDTVCDADFLYSPATKLFLSIDTPRSVKAKGEYARKKGLGGLFTWTIDMDNGLLLNAAREGLGFQTKRTDIDMTPFYFQGKSA